MYMVRLNSTNNVEPSHANYHPKFKKKEKKKKCIKGKTDKQSSQYKFADQLKGKTHS